MKILLTLIALSLFSFGAHAEPTATATVDGSPFGDVTMINHACTNPGHFNHQNPPTDIVIGCAILDMKWRMGKPGRMTFPGLRILTAGLMSDKAGVVLADVDFKFPPTRSSFPCPNFVETRGTGNAEFKVTCSDIASMLANHEGIVDFCNKSMVNLVDADETLMVTVPTGKTSTGCGMGGHGQN